jgi:DNA-binding response OmpR family regulator
MATILIVEDDEEIRGLIASVVADDGHAVMVEETLAGGFAALGRQRVDCVIADVMLPDGRGTELIDAAHAHGVQCLLTTGHPEEIARLGQRAVPFLAKPFRTRWLVAELRRLMKATPAG